MTKFGKFNSAEELLKGYNELEKSFTQKCQQLSELQKEHIEQYSEADNSNEQSLASLPTEQLDGTNAEASPSEMVQSTTVDSVDTVPKELQTDVNVSFSDHAPDPTPSDEMLQQYLENNPSVAYRLLQQRTTEFAPNVMIGGGNVSLASPSRPKTIKEASLMAKDLFK